MKVVLDTNVIVAAFAARGLCSALFELCLDRCDVVLSEAILEETRNRLTEKIKIPGALCEEVIAYLRVHCILSAVEYVDPSLCRDKGDLHILGLAKGAGAPYIVTGDRDLLDLETFQDARIITPREFWEVLKGSDK